MIRSTKLTSLFAVMSFVALLQVLVQAGIPDVETSPVDLYTLSEGTLSTSGNKPVLVNGTSATSQATILSESTIETPKEIVATVDLGAQGNVELEPNTKIVLEFKDGNASVRVIFGCVTFRNLAGNAATIYDNSNKVLAATSETETLTTCKNKALPFYLSFAGAAVGILSVTLNQCDRGANPSPSSPSQCS